MAVEVRSGEERRGLVLNQRLLVRLRRNPEDDHVVVALAGDRIDRVRPRITEEDERLPADLVDGILVGPVLDGDVRHGQSYLVHVLDACGSTAVVGHRPRLGAGVERPVVSDQSAPADRAHGATVPRWHTLDAWLRVPEGK